MPNKRSRLSRSFSSAVLTENQPSEFHLAAVKMAKSLEEDRALPILVDVAVSSAVTQGQIWNFLEMCYLCKKKITENDAVFMYSSNAYCTPECRDYQIEKDKLAKEASRRSKPVQNMCDARKNMDYPVVTQP